MRALLSVYDKMGLIELAAGLIDLGWEIVSTGGTLRALSEAGIPARAVAEVTGFPEILDGRVKTLHPAIHSGLLARRDDPAHLATLAQHGIGPIDLLAGNLYPFAATVADPTVPFAEAIEQIDVGGPAMIRAAAKNHAGVLVLTDPADYAPILAEIVAGGVAPAIRRDLAAKAFAHIAAYDAVVADYLRGDGFPAEVSLAGRKAQDLRYGENPHQAAAAYRRLIAGTAPRGILDAEQFAGKELSFNNLLDADAAWAVVSALPGEEPAVCIVKHTIPCGAAVRGSLPSAFAAALAGDPVSAFGGIVALTQPLDAETATLIADIFFEVVIAPGFTLEARELLGRKRGLRLLQMPPIETRGPPRAAWDVRPISGGLLLQEADTRPPDESTWRVVSPRPPTAAEWADLRFAWAVVRHVKSNAIVLARDRSLVGVGVGQPNRLGSVRLAADTAGPRARGAALASDAFFPFADGVATAAAAGVTAVIQPGGSVRDPEVLVAADAAGLAMVFTGQRHFRH